MTTGFFAQDSWRVEVEPDAELRPAVRAPVAVHADERHLLDVDARGPVRPVGRGHRTGRAAVQPVQARLAAQSRARSRRTSPTIQATPATTRTTTTSRRRSARVAAERAERLRARTILGDPDLATVSGGYTRTFNRERFDRFTGTFGNNPGATQPATRGTDRRPVPARAGGRVLAAAAIRETAAGSALPDVPGARRPIRFRPSSTPATTSRSSTRISWCRTPTRGTIGFQRSLDRDTAIEVPVHRQQEQARVGERELEPREHHREQASWTSSSWPRPTCAPTCSPAAAARSRYTGGRAPRRCRSSSRTSRVCRRSPGGRSRGLHVGATSPTATFVDQLDRVLPGARTTSPGSLWTTRRRSARTRRPPGSRRTSGS